jgi:hypothetical protein
MPRNRTIYQSLGLFTGPTGFSFSSGNSGVNFLTQLHRVQTFNSSVSLSRSEINQFGQLSAIDRPIVEAPTVPIDFSYYVTNGHNESGLGFPVNNTSALTNFLTKTNDEKCFYLLVGPEGVDVNVSAVNSSQSFVQAIGNAFLTNYTIEASVGGFATASVSAEGQNLRIYQGSTGLVMPQVNPQNGSIGTNLFSIPTLSTGTSDMVPALRAGDITLKVPSGAAFGAVTSGNGSCHLQNFSMTVPLSRENLNRIGSKYAYSKELTVPVTVTANFSALAADLQNSFLDQFLCDETFKTIQVEMREPSCNTSGPLSFAVTLAGAKLDSTNYSNSIGPNGTVDFQLSVVVGSSGDVNNYIAFSGSQ